MECSFINRTKQTWFKQYYPCLLEVSKKCEEVLELDDDYSISVIFVRSAKIKEINRQYRNINKVTDVISFALNDEIDDYEMIEENKDLGDIFINIDYVISQATAYGHSQKREIGFLFCHGLLHCLGYDHMTKEDEEVMFGLQNKIIDQVVSRD